MKTLPDMVAPWVAAPRTSRSGPTASGGATPARRSARYFEIDAPHIAAAAMSALARDGQITGEEAAAAIAKLGIDPDKADPRAS